MGLLLLMNAFTSSYYGTTMSCNRNKLGIETQCSTEFRNVRHQDTEFYRIK